MLFASMLSDNRVRVPAWSDARWENAICMPHSHLPATKLIHYALFICLPIHTYVCTHTHTLFPFVNLFGLCNTSGRRATDPDWLGALWNPITWATFDDVANSFRVASWLEPPITSSFVPRVCWLEFWGEFREMYLFALSLFVQLFGGLLQDKVNVNILVTPQKMGLYGTSASCSGANMVLYAGCCHIWWSRCWKLCSFV